MPTQAELNPEGPQNILRGAIMLNDVAVVDGWTQFNAYSMEQWHKEIDKLPIINLYIGEDSDGYGFECTSAEVVNSVIDRLGRAVTE